MHEYGQQSTLCQNVVMILHRYPVLLFLGGILVSFSGSTWFTGKNDVQFPQLPKPYQLFPSIGKVVEIADGSMERFSDVLQRSEVSAVLFYAPWCGQSTAASQEFNRAAKILYKEASFIAINCWTGSCYQQQKIDLFPKLVAIHTHFDGLEYKGPYKTSKMVVFLQSVIRPFVYIGTDTELHKAKQSNQELVISYFNQPMIANKNYTTFFHLALQFRVKESRPTFAMITTGKLALKAGLNSVSRVAYHRLNHNVLNYPMSNNFTAKDLTSWIDANRYELVVQLTLQSDRKDHFVHHLSKGPALILFLPLKLHMSKAQQHILDTYIHTASLYFNCSCSRTSKAVQTISQNTEVNNRKDTGETLKENNFNEVDSDTSQFTKHFNVMTNQGDFLIASKDWNLPLLLAHERSCQSLPVPKQSNLENKRNICDVCYTCQLQKCQQNMGSGLQSLLSSDIVTALSSLMNGCSSFRPGYYGFATTSICCTVQEVETTGNLSSLEQFKPTNLESLRQTERSLDDVLSDLVAAMVSPVKPGFHKDQDEATSTDAKNTARQAVPLEENHDSLRMFPGDETKNNSCETTGHVTQFTGAGCHSNRSVNFFLMDSTEYWGVAERLGVRDTPKGRKTALVIADLENDAHFVLDEDLEITNSSIVEFVMAYMAGNLARRFRSKRARSQECTSSQACVIEVVTSNFRETVLDETKDVLLLYYAPWCGYCHVLGPLLLTVAKFFQSVTDVIIARINADENDLPWQFYVSHYPSLILFPAYRKDFSIPFPASVERTAANIVEFVLDHGVKASKVFEEFSLPEMVRGQINELETLLCEIEEEKGILEMKLREAVRTKELWYHRSAVTLESLQMSETDVAKERVLRLDSENLIKNFEQQQQQVDEKVLKLIGGSTDVLNDLAVAEAKLIQKEELLTQLSFVLESEQLFAKLRKTEIALQEQKKVVVGLQKSSTAVRRRVTQLEISNVILRTKLKNLNLKWHYSIKNKEKHHGNLHESIDLAESDRRLVVT